MTAAAQSNTPSLPGFKPAPRGPRITFTFTVPKSVLAAAKTDLPQKITLAWLSADQELIASRLGRFDSLAINVEGIKMAIIALDGKQMDPSTGEVDTFWENAGPKLRSLLLQAYDRISAPSKEEENDFFKSEQMAVG